MKIGGVLLVLTGLLLMVGVMASAQNSVPTNNVLTYGVTAMPESVDPQVSMDNNSWRAIYYCYDRLVEYDGGTTKLRPGLASSWDISSDGITYTFHLRQGISFTDGTPFNAKAVAFSFNRLFNIGKAPSGLFGFIKSVEVTDNYTVRITLKAPFAPALSAFAADEGCIVSPGVMKHEVNSDWGQNWLAGHTDGTGPFYVSEWTRGLQLVLKRNNNYWQAPAKLQQVTLKYIPESVDLGLLLSKGAIDIAETLTVDQIAKLRGAPGIRIFEAPSFACHYVYLNCQNRYLKDVHVRRAISYAVDYKGIIDNLWKGAAVQMDGPVPIGLVGHTPVYEYSQDIDRAQALLKEAGYDKGFSLSLMISPTIPEWRSMALVIQEDLAKIGIKVKVESYAWATLRAKLDKGDFDMSFGYWTPDYADADMFTWFWFYSKNWGLAGNRAWYKNSVMDDLVTQERTEVNPQKRMELFQGIQWLGVSDAPYLYLLQAKYQLAMRDWVKGYVYNPMLLNMPNFYGMYIEK